VDIMNRFRLGIQRKLARALWSVSLLSLVQPAYAQLELAHYELKRVGIVSQDGCIAECEANSYDENNVASSAMEHPVAAFDTRIAVGSAADYRAVVANALGAATCSGDVDEERFFAHATASVTNSCHKFLAGPENAENVDANGYARSRSKWAPLALEDYPEIESGWIIGDLHISTSAAVWDAGQQHMLFSNDAFAWSTVGDSWLHAQYNSTTGWTVTWNLQNGYGSPVVGTTVYPPLFTHTAPVKQVINYLGQYEVSARCYNKSSADTYGFTGTDLKSGVTATLVATAGFYIDANLEQ
jgi:hypothetical protein